MPVVAWGAREQLGEIQHLLGRCVDGSLHCIPRELNVVADRIAAFALRNRESALFQRGADVPSWLLEAAHGSDFKCKSCCCFVFLSFF